MDLFTFQDTVDVYDYEYYFENICKAIYPNRKTYDENGCCLNSNETDTIKQHNNLPWHQKPYNYYVPSWYKDNCYIAILPGTVIGSKYSTGMHDQYKDPIFILKEDVDDVHVQTMHKHNKCKITGKFVLYYFGGSDTGFYRISTPKSFEKVLNSDLNFTYLHFPSLTISDPFDKTVLEQNKTLLLITAVF